MNKWYITLSLMAFSFTMNAQQTEIQMVNSTPEDSVTINLNVDFATLQLPPLSVLYANATSNPTVKMMEKERQLQKKLLSKEKRSWLSFFSARAGYSHGVTDNFGTITDVTTPIFYQYTGVEQDYWNVGGNVNIPLETLFDLGGKVKRQRIVAERAEYAKEQAYNQVNMRRNGNMAGNPYGNIQMGGCDVCDMCSTMLCMNMCCNCLGGGICRC